MRALDGVAGERAAIHKATTSRFNRLAQALSAASISVSVYRRPASIAERLGHMRPANLLRAGQIRNRARHAQHPVITVRRQLHRSRRLRQQLVSRLVRPGHLLQPLTVNFRIGTRLAGRITTGQM